MRLKVTRTAGFLLLLLWPGELLRTQSKEGSSFDQSKYVPDIALILDVSALTRDIANERFYSLATPGFNYPFVNRIGPDISNAHRGWNFNYGELSLYSVVDPYFDLFAVIDLEPEAAGLEEAYFSTRKLPYGLKAKVGKFLASFGRVNEQHEHFWDFANRPLIAAALFGEEGLNEIGGQVTWVPPTSFYLTVGLEVLNGSNQQSFGTSGFRDPSGAISVAPVQGPNLSIGFVRSSFDIDEASILFGLSDAVGTTRTDEDFTSAGAAGNAVSASTNIFGGDLTAKYSLDAIHYLSFQSEYMVRVMNGTEYTRDSTNVTSSSSLEKHHSGFYVQLGARVDQVWKIGVRYDLLMQNDVSTGGATQHLPSNLPRYSAVIDYSPTEFSRIRLQCDRDLSRYVEGAGGWSLQPYTQISLQANLVIGAHGAHAF